MARPRSCKKNAQNRFCFDRAQRRPRQPQPAGTASMSDFNNDVAAARATSLARVTAMPKSAWSQKAGASLMPSLTKATRSPRV